VTTADVPGSTPALPLLDMRGIVKTFNGVVANDSVNLTVAKGEVHALLGENGAGKSTLMQVLYGAYRPDAGEIRFAGRVVRFRNQAAAIAAGIGMIHQDFMLVRPFTVVENVMLGLVSNGLGMLPTDVVAARLSMLSTQHGLEVDPLARIEQLSVGEQQRVEILKLLYRDTKLLILDEPTAVLTPDETQRLLATLRSLASQGRSIIIVTHKLHEVIEVADRVTIMRDGHTLATVAKATTSETELARLMVGRDVALKIRRPPLLRGRQLLDIRSLHVQDDRGELAVREFDLKLHAGEIVGIAGVDGNGQSQLVEALMGLRAITAGQVLFDGVEISLLPPAAHVALGMAYVPADRRHVGSVGALSIEDNAILCSQQQFTRTPLSFLNRQSIRAHAQALMAHFDIRAPDPGFKAGLLSGGNLQKLILGRELSRQPGLLIVEQPTRGLDVSAIEFVWTELLNARAQGMAILLVSTELEEIRNLADRIVVLYDGCVMGELDSASATDQRLGPLMAGLPAIGVLETDHAIAV